MDIQVHDINCKDCCPKVHICTYKQTYVVVRRCITLHRADYPDTYGVDSYPVGIRVICPIKCNTKSYDYICLFVGTYMYLGATILTINIMYLYVHVRP